jgi:hypothetical protein
MRTSLFLALTLVGPGCAPPREEVAVGELCVIGAAANGTTTFPAGAPLQVRLGTNPRLCRPLCDTLVSGPCTVVRAGNTFRVQGRIEVEVTCTGEPPPRGCSDVALTCATEPVGPGVYIVTDGVRSVTVTVPQRRPSGDFRVCMR